MKAKTKKKNKSVPVGAKDFDLVVGLTGLKAAGKDELSERLAAHGFVTRRCSDEIRDEAKRRGIASPTVGQLIEIGNWGREMSGDGGYWPKRVLKTLKAQGHRRVIINGLRHPDEVKGLREFAGDAFVMVGIVAPLEIRSRRLLKRSRAGDPMTVEDFMRLDDADRGIGQPSYGQQVDRTLAQVPWENLFNNQGTLEEFQAWIDAFIRRIFAERGL